MSTATPRSIKEYLEQLRVALGDADPALIQDALYDAEEHLRGEMHDNPGKSEAEVLAKITTSYGAPEEVAEIYVDKEVSVQEALRAPPQRRRSTALGRFFAVGSDPRAYAALFYMVLSLATGIVYFVFTIVGISLSFGLAILVIGIPVAIIFLGTARVLSLVEGRLVEVMLGERMPRRPIYAQRNVPLKERIWAMFADPRTWSTLLYFVLKLPLGIIYFTLAITGTVVSLAFITAPLAHVGWMLGIVRVDWATHVHFNDTLILPPVVVDPLMFITGIAMLFGMLHLARGIGRFQGALAKNLLVKSAG
jgi:uncharacterized membrane protein